MSDGMHGGEEVNGGDGSREEGFDKEAMAGESMSIEGVSVEGMNLEGMNVESNTQEGVKQDGPKGEGVNGVGMNGVGMNGDGPKREASATDSHRKGAVSRTARARAAASRTQQASAENSSTIDFSVPTLKHFATYTRVTQTLEAYLLAALRESRRLDHILINGRPGTGTSTLARALVRDYAPSRVEEFDAQGGISTQKLHRALLRANKRGVVLIRHIELLDPMLTHMLVNYMGGRPLPRLSRGGGEGRPSAPWETDRDRAIAESARDTGDAHDAARDVDAGPTTPGATIIGTCLVPARLNYSLRSRFEQTINLRSDPKALRAALVRVMRQRGIALEPSCFPRVDRFLGTLTDGTEPLARGVLVRADIESVTTIDDELMRSIIDEDMPTRILDTHYAAALRDHLGGRKIKAATVEEIDRIVAETQWGPIAAQAAIATMLRENRARKRSEQPPAPL
jgi:hypothetical protein